MPAGRDRPLDLHIARGRNVVPVAASPKQRRRGRMPQLERDAFKSNRIALATL